MTSLRFTEWSMGEGVLYNLVFTEWRHCVSQNSYTGINLFNNAILHRRRYLFMQKWNSDMDNSPQSINFRMFKHNFERENYLITLPSILWIPLCKFRNHRLPVEKFRQNAEDRNVPRKRSGRRVSICMKMFLFAEQMMLLLGKRIFTHPSISTSYNVINFSVIKLIKLSKLMQIIVKNASG